jgi:hypothetical protein
VGVRYDASEKKFYIKSYGKDEYEAKDTQAGWIQDITYGGDEISKEEYENL